MIAMLTTGAVTSGNSSVLRRISAIKPKITSATITTVVMIGFLIA